MYIKEGINVRDYGAEVVEVSRDKQEPTVITETPKSSWIDSILKVGQVSTQAKGLNNSANALILYGSQNNGLSITFDTNYRTRGKIRTTSGDYNTQRFWFDNGTNQIRLNNTNQCLDVYGGNFYAGAQVYVWDCHGGASQKWFFDEQGRLATLYNQDLCLDSYGGLNWGADLGLWTCHTGASESFRAGYNNFGTNMGMSIWATGVGGNISSFLDGHAYMELWNNYGMHNTFGKWPSGDYVCFNGARSNNICDYDAVNVDNPWEIAHYYNPVINGTNYYKKGTWSWLSKNDWDYITFGSGYRSNYKYNGVFMDLGGWNTYYYNWSKSRDVNYPSRYETFGNNYCSTYALSFWRKFRDFNSTFVLDLPVIITPNHIVNTLP